MRLNSKIVEMSMIITNNIWVLHHIMVVDVMFADFTVCVFIVLFGPSFKCAGCIANIGGVQHLGYLGYKKTLGYVL